MLEVWHLKDCIKCHTLTFASYNVNCVACKPRWAHGSLCLTIGGGARWWRVGGSSWLASRREWCVCSSWIKVTQTLRKDLFKISFSLGSQNFVSWTQPLEMQIPRLHIKQHSFSSPSKDYMERSLKYVLDDLLPNNCLSTHPKLLESYLQWWKYFRFAIFQPGLFTIDSFPNKHDSYMNHFKLLCQTRKVAGWICSSLCYHCNVGS